MTSPTSLSELFAYNAKAYQPLLHSTSFRLVELIPGTGSDFSCLVHTIDDAKQAPKYSALSYCWGTVTEAQHLCCNEQNILITNNLYSALKRLRDSPEHRFIWVDAICINQHDDSERNQQVSNMRNIYADASSVIVWLGPEDEHSELALSLMRKVVIGHAAEFLQMPTLSKWPEELNDQHTLRNFRRSLLESGWGEQFDGNNTKWQSLYAIYHRPWFSRVWIVQEICTAQKAVVFCGREEEAWWVVGLCAHWLYNSTTATAGAIRRNVIQMAKDTAGAIGPSRAVFLTVLNRSTIYESPFLRLLDSSLQFKATEPKDKIFALLHHQIHRKENSNQYGSCQGIPHLALGIDYSLTISQVNREVALQSILQYKSLEALNYAWRIRLPRSQGPSWVAEWHSELPDRRQPLRPCLYNASGLTSPQDVQLVAPNALSLKGVYIDTVLERDPIVDMQKWFLRSTCRTNNNASNDVQRARKLESLSALLVRDAIDPSNEMLAKRLDQADRVKCMKSFAAYLSGLFAEHKDEAFLIALQGNRMCDACMAPVSPPVTQIPQNIYNCRICRQGNFDLCPPCFQRGERCANKDHVITSGVMPALRWRSDHEFMNYLQMVAEAESPSFFERHQKISAIRRTLFTSAEGRLGYCPLHVQPGDRIVILFGGRTPFILRQTAESRYTLVSDCYLHGMMDGEALQDLGGSALVSTAFPLYCNQKINSKSPSVAPKKYCM